MHASVAFTQSIMGCVHVNDFPQLHTPKDPSLLYNSSTQSWESVVKGTRVLVRRWALRHNFSLSVTDGEQLVTSDEVRRKYSGIVLVGDSQVRELAWAILKLVTPHEELRFGNDSRQLFSEGKTEDARARSRRRLRSACLPQTVGKLGFTAVCYQAAQGTSTPLCRLYSPFNNATHMERSKRLWLFR